jgi:hypothetical protein
MAQLAHLRDLEVEPVPGVKVAIIPISKGSRGEGYGSSIVWDARLFRPGVMGPRAVSEAELVGAGVPEEEARRLAGQTEKALATLRRLYPVLTVAIEARVRAIEAAVPAALPGS